MRALVRPLPWLCFVLVGLGAAVPGSAAPMSVQLTTPEKAQLQREARLVVDLVQNFHYSGQTFQQVSNAEILASFLTELDPQSNLLAPEEVEFLHRRFDRTLKTVYLFRGDLTPAFEIFDTYSEAVTRRLQWIDQRIGQDFDFTVDEAIDETDEAKGAASRLSLDQRWERRLKDEMLAEIVAGRSPEAARTHLRQRYREVAKNLALYDSFSVREHFLNAALHCFDPHSGYFSADSTREFASLIEGTTTGVGLDLARVRGRCVVERLLPGGPADLHSPLAPGDTVEALANGDGPWVDVSNQRWRETLALLRGARGTSLRMAFRPPGAVSRQEVTLVRERLVLTQSRVRGAISDVPTEAGGTRRVGWITFPSFYGTPGRAGVHVSTDLRELIQAMTAARIEALVIDLRSNPGGELTEAASCVGLFVPGGTVMLQRKPDGTITPLLAKPVDAPAYLGPLVVLTAPSSASAAEIFAAAMKQHRRGLVVGGVATYGKGSSQSVFDLAKAAQVKGAEAKDWGTLRLTMERFYGPDGSAIQGTGVASQVVLPSIEASKFKREADQPHALPAESVTPPPASVAPGPPALPDTLAQSLADQAARDVANLPEWSLWIREARARESSEFKVRSLQRERRQQAWRAFMDEWIGICQSRRALAAAAFPTRPVDLAEVREALAAHQQKLLAEAKIATPPARPIYLDHQILAATDQGHVEAIHVSRFRFRLFLGDAAELSRAVAREIGQPVNDVQLGAALQELALLDEQTEAAILAVLATALPPNLDQPTLGRALGAMLSRMAELEPGLAAERPPLDIPLREALRLGAAWAQAAANEPARGAGPGPASR